MAYFDRENQLYKFDCGCEFPVYGDVKDYDNLPMIKIDYDNINYGCSDTWDLFKSGATLGVFQLENGLGQRWSKTLRPENLLDVSDLVALIRPGTLNAYEDDKNGEPKSMTEWFADRRNGKEPNIPKFPAIEYITGQTNQVLLYQEQTIRIAQEICGYSSSEGDILRKSVGKKDAQALLSLEESFVTGAFEKGLITREEAIEIFQWIKASARYQFNKSHSCSYAVLSYFSAYAKTHFPKHFTQTYLTFAKSTAKKKKKQHVSEIIKDAKSRGIYIQPPSILNVFRNSGDFCMVDGKLFFSLNAIKGVAKNTIQNVRDLITEQSIVLEDIRWIDLLFKVLVKTNKTTVEALIKAGALDYYGVPRKTMIYEYDILKKFTGKHEIPWMAENYISDLESTIEKSILSDDKIYSNKNRFKKAQELLEVLRSPGYNIGDDDKYSMRHEKEYLGLPISVSGVDVVQAGVETTNCLEACNAPHKNMIIKAAIESERCFKIKKGKNQGSQMCVCTLEDEYGLVEGILWPDKLEDYEHLIYEGNVVLIFANPSSKEKQVYINKVCQL